MFIYQFEKIPCEGKFIFSHFSQKTSKDKNMQISQDNSPMHGKFFQTLSVPKILKTDRDIQVFLLSPFAVQHLQFWAFSAGNLTKISTSMPFYRMADTDKFYRPSNALEFPDICFFHFLEIAKSPFMVIFKKIRVKLIFKAFFNILSLDLAQFWSDSSRLCCSMILDAFLGDWLAQNIFTFTL